VIRQHCVARESSSEGNGIRYSEILYKSIDDRRWQTILSKHPPRNVCYRATGAVSLDPTSCWLVPRSCHAVARRGRPPWFVSPGSDGSLLLSVGQSLTKACQCLSSLLRVCGGTSEKANCSSHCRRRRHPASFLFSMYSVGRRFDNMASTSSASTFYVCIGSQWHPRLYCTVLLTTFDGKSYKSRTTRGPYATERKYSTDSSDGRRSFPASWKS
jgi:hypothetical protein